MSFNNVTINVAIAAVPNAHPEAIEYIKREAEDEERKADNPLLTQKLLDKNKEANEKQAAEIKAKEDEYIKNALLTRDGSDPAVISEIKKEATWAAFGNPGGIKAYAQGEEPFKIDVEHVKRVLGDITKLWYAAREEHHKRLNADTDFFSDEYKMRYSFFSQALNSEALGEITEELSDETRLSGHIAYELEMMIQSAKNKNGATIEERAMNRETGLRNAQYLAENYFDDPEDVKKFMESINKLAQEDILIEKGFVSDYDYETKTTTLRPPYIDKNTGRISASAYFQNRVGGRLGVILGSLVMGTDAGSITASYGRYAQEVAAKIEKGKNALTDEYVAKSLERLLRAIPDENE